MLRGKHVVVVADADDAGRSYAQKVAASLHGKAASVIVVEIPGSKDLAEAIGKGLTRDSLLALFEKTPGRKGVTTGEILVTFTWVFSPFCPGHGCTTARHCPLGA